MAGLGTEPFSLSVAQGEAAATISLVGEIDYAASLAIGPKLDRIARESDTAILFDLDKVTLIDSEGIKMLLSAAESIRSANRRVEILRCSDRVEKVLKLAGVQEALLSNR